MGAIEVKFKKLEFKATRVRNQFEALIGYKHDRECMYRIFEDNNNDLHLSYTDSGRYEVLKYRLKSIDEGMEIAQRHFEQKCQEIIERIAQ